MGDVFGIENVENDTFAVHFLGNIETTNGHYNLGTKDLDGDGRPECFLGGSYNGPGPIVNRILETGGCVSVFKASCVDSYFLFWLKQVPSPDAIGIGDVDGDGTDEIVIAQSIFENNRSYSRSRIYKFDPTSVGIESEKYTIPVQIELAQN